MITVTKLIECVHTDYTQLEGRPQSLDWTSGLDWCGGVRFYASLWYYDACLSITPLEC